MGRYTNCDVGRRFVGLPPALVEFLRGHRVEQERRGAARQLWQDGEWVCTSAVGAH